MDRKISEQTIKQRTRKRIVKIAIALVVVIVVFTLLTNLLRPSIALKDVIVSTVSRGALSVSVSASGKVLPIYEEVITSPISSKIVAVLKKAGDSLSAGDAIVELDLESLDADMERQRDELELKRLKLEQFKITTQSTLDDVAMQIKVDGMKLKRMEVLLRNEKYLDSIGASTSDKVKQTELEHEVQVMQYEQLRQKFINQKANAAVDVKSMELDYKVAVKNSRLMSKTMREAAVFSPRTATLTWVNDQVGTSVSVGAQLAIVSDLKNYKIEGELSDSYSDKISPGSRVEFKIGGDLLTGVIGNIAPSVANGLLKFSVAIDKSDYPKLRSGLRVDLYVINSIKEDVLCIDNHSFYVGAGEYDLWVINDGNIAKRKVTLGENSFDKVEVITGLKNGDKVIVSDMNRFNDKSQINIK